MKGFLLIAALCVSSALAWEPELHDVPEILTKVPECTKRELGWYWPNFDDATRFYQCGGINWLFDMPCAPGTWFSFEHQVCVHPYQWVSPEPPTPRTLPTPSPTPGPTPEVTPPPRPPRPSGKPPGKPWWPHPPRPTPTDHPGPSTPESTTPSGPPTAGPTDPSGPPTASPTLPTAGPTNPPANCECPPRTN